MSRSIFPRVKSRDALASAFPAWKKPCHRALIRHMPVVEKIIVEQRAPHQGPLIHPDTQPVGQPDTGAGHRDRVVEDGYISVLHKLFFQLHVGGGENIASVQQQLFFIYRILHRFSFLYTKD